MSQATQATKPVLEEEIDPSAWAIEGDVDYHNQAPEFEMPPLGMYTWELTGKAKDQPQAEKYNKSGDKKRTQFFFTLVDDDDWEGFVAKQFLNLSLNEKSYFRPFVEAMLGRELEPKEEVGWEDGTNPKTGNPIVGIGHKRFMAVLTEDKKEDGRIYGRLTAPIPLQQKRKPRAKQQAEEAAADPVPF